MDSRYSQWHGSDHAIVGETNGYNDLCIGSSKRGRLQRHSASGSDGKSKAKRRSRSDVGLCESSDEYFDDEHDLVAKSSGRSVVTARYDPRIGNDFGQQRERHDDSRHVSVYIHDYIGL